jgi:surface antigen
VTDNETREGLGLSQPLATTSVTDPLTSQDRIAAVRDARQNAEFPSRRSLRSVEPVAGEPLAARPSAPAAPGSRRAAREALAAADIPAPPTAPQVAAPFGTFASASETEHAIRTQRVRTSAPAAARTTAAAAPARSTRKRLSVVGVMLLVPGLFVSLTLPAYASADYTGQLAESDAADVGAQKLALSVADVDAATAVSGDSRDAYDSVSASDLKRLYRDALKQQRMAEYLASGAQALGDDYPWATSLGMSQGGGLSPLRYFVRQCVDFVAWRLNRDAGSYGEPFKYDWSSLTPGGGNASSWKSQWDKHGWATSTTPSPGWVAWFPGANHVAYVNSVLADGSVLIEEYNWGGADVYNQRIIPASSAIYLTPPPR